MNLVALGTSYKIADHKNHSAEVQYDFKKANIGMFGQPLFVRFGADYALQNNLNWNWGFNFGKGYTFSQRIDFKPLDNIKVSFSDRGDAYNAFFDLKNINYSWGWAIEFNV